MINSKKKGFTIVELVIVIAVVAILAAVLIPTFSNLIKKANESSDIQAVRNMNVHITSANISGEMKSPLDVYSVFDDSGYEVENYKPLYKGRSFYYDVQRKCMVYVDDETGKILYPAEYLDETQGTNNWLSLSMSIAVTEKDKPSNFTEPSGNNNNTMSATVTNGKEYAYVLDEYNSASEGTALNLNGANISIEETKGEVIISGTNNAIIKNISSDKYFIVSTDNTNAIPANYGASALVINANHKVSISNVTFDNLNIKTPDAGNVGLLCSRTASADGYLEINNVTIQNSTVIGGRSVAALVGATPGGSGKTAVQLTGNLTLNNVHVGTTQGRSSLLVNTNIEEAMKIAQTANISITNSTCRMVEDSRFEQVKVSEATYKGEEIEHKIIDADGNPSQTFAIYAKKSLDKNSNDYTFYAHKDDALVLQYKVDKTREAIMTVEDLYSNYR